MVIFACSTDVNPVIPPVVISSDTTNSYNWDIDTLLGYSSEDIYQLDSEHVYLATNPRPTLYQNGKFSSIGNNDNNFIALRIQAIAPDYIVTAGSFSIQNPFRFTGAFKIYRGKSPELFQLPGDTTTWDIRDLMIIDRDKIWFLNYSNKLYYFDNGNFTTLTFNETLNLEFEQFLLKNNELYVLGKLYDSQKTLQQIKIYRFNGSEFEVTNTLSGTDYVNYKSLKIKDEFLLENITGLYIINGNNITQFTTLPMTAYSSYSGTSRNNIIKAQGLFFQPGFIYTWNGLRWRKEDNIILTHDVKMDAIKVSVIKNGHVYISGTSRFSGVTFITAGKKIH